MKHFAGVLIVFLSVFALSTQSFAHCGGCGAGEPAKEHKHGDDHAACVKKCDSAKDQASCKKGCDDHHPAAKPETETKTETKK